MTACIVWTRGDDVVVLQDTLVSRRLRNGAVRPFAEMRKFHLVADGGMVLCGAGPLAPLQAAAALVERLRPRDPAAAVARVAQMLLDADAAKRLGPAWYLVLGRRARSGVPCAYALSSAEDFHPRRIPRHAIRANIPLNAALVEVAFRREARPWDFAGEIWALPAALRDGIGGEIECCIVSRDGIRITPMMRAFWSNGRRRRMPQRGVPAPSAPAWERPPEDPVFFS